MNQALEVESQPNKVLLKYYQQNTLVTIEIKLEDAKRLAADLERVIREAEEKRYVIVKVQELKTLDVIRVNGQSYTITSIVIENYPLFMGDVAAISNPKYLTEFVLDCSGIKFKFANDEPVIKLLQS